MFSTSRKQWRRGHSSRPGSKSSTPLWSRLSRAWVHGEIFYQWKKVYFRDRTILRAPSRLDNYAMLIDRNLLYIIESDVADMVKDYGWKNSSIKGTGDIVPALENKKVIDNRWVYKFNIFLMLIMEVMKLTHQSISGVLIKYERAPIVGWLNLYKR